MDSLYLLIPIALVFTAVAIKAFFWAVDNKQFDDLDVAAHSILFDEDADLMLPSTTKSSMESNNRRGAQDD